MYKVKRSMDKAELQHINEMPINSVFRDNLVHFNVTCNKYYWGLKNI